jgi:endogenous inhibitor of DNA gyrase (YacG/DUF329 family)
MKNIPEFCCPDCNCPSERMIFYNTNPDKTKGRYHCPDCGRDTLWSDIKPYNIHQVFSMMKEDENEYKN